MPKTKQFESFSLNEFIFGIDRTIYLDMYEMSEIFYKNIIQAYDYLEQGKKVSIEVPNDECLYHLERENSDKFILTKNNNYKQELSAIETVNWLFAKSPFISLVGYSNA